MVLQQLAPEAILSVLLLIPQQLSEVTLIDFCIAPIIAVRLYKKILDLLEGERVSGESVSGESSGRASLHIRREVLSRMLEKVSRSLKYDLNVFFVHKHISREI